MASHVAFPLIAGPAVEHAECAARASGRASEHRDRNCQGLRQARGARHGGRGHRELPIMWAVKIVAKVKKPGKVDHPGDGLCRGGSPVLSISYEWSVRARARVRLGDLDGLLARRAAALRPWRPKLVRIRRPQTIPFP